MAVDVYGRQYLLARAAHGLVGDAADLTLNVVGWGDGAPNAHS